MKGIGKIYSKGPHEIADIQADLDRLHLYMLLSILRDMALLMCNLIFL